jgi:flagellar M-ring protein FliF
MAFLGQTSSQLRQLWERLGRGQRMALVAIGVGAVVFALIFLRMGGQQSYVTAFTNLDPKDSSAAADQLKADAIPYQVTPDGTTIKVASNRLADARLKLAAKGLPHGGAVGFELFDKSSFGVTDFEQNVNYQRALEGELSRTIDTLDQVANSRVAIVVPKEELFVSQQKPATASVMLQLRPGRTLDGSALKGLAHLVSRSVEGLDEKNITIVDTTGKLLYDGSDDSVTAGLSTSQLDLEQRTEKGLETQLQSLLDQVAGSGKSVVRVKADMDFSQQESTSETYSPGGPNNQGVPRSSSTTKETYNGAVQPQGGQPGAAANDPNVPKTVAAAAAGGATQYDNSQTTTNYEVNKTTQKTVASPGQVKRLSVSVLLDSSISDQDASGLHDAIAAAAGINEQRGDQVVVTTASFNGNQTAQLAPIARPGPLDMVSKYGKLVVPVLAALIVLFVIWRMSRSVSPKKPRTLVMSTQPALPSGGAEAAYLWTSKNDGSLDEMDRTQPLAEAPRLQLNEAQVRQRQEVQDRMTDLATKNPEAVAEIIHSWMSKDERKK